MCGRFVLRCTIDEVKDEFDLGEIQWAFEPSFNIAPGQEILAVQNGGQRRLAKMRWGLIPSWAKDPAIGDRMINARAETLAQKPSFSRPLKDRRCLIIASGFYEWRVRDGKKFPVYIRLRSDRPFGFAGLYEVWRPPNGEAVTSCTIITTSPNELLAPIHNRMPVIIRREDRSEWLDHEVHDPQRLLKFLNPYPASELEAYDVSTRCNSPKYNQPDCIEPVAQRRDGDYGAKK
jgi:putative SOS response-associated peptidase YedK